MAKLRIQQGSYVRHYRSTEVYKVLEVHGPLASLIDAENRHLGTYPFDELTPVHADKVKVVKKWEASQ